MSTLPPVSHEGMFDLPKCHAAVGTIRAAQSGLRPAPRAAARRPESGDEVAAQFSGSSGVPCRRWWWHGTPTTSFIDSLAVSGTALARAPISATCTVQKLRHRGFQRGLQQ